MSDERKIFRYDIDYGRGFCVEGMFVGTDKEIEQICKQTVHFGEICGKHSEMSVDFEPGDFSVVPATEEIISWFVENVGLTGHNPLNYLYCSECGADWGEGEYCPTCEECCEYKGVEVQQEPVEQEPDDTEESDDDNERDEESTETEELLITI